MRAIRFCILVVLTVVACGGNGGKDVDALIIIPDAAIDAPPDAFEPVFDFSCMGNTQGAAAANITVGGFAAEVVLGAGGQPALQAAHNASVEICKASSATCTNTDRLDQKMTPMTGCPAMGCPFTSSALPTTAMAPLDLYAKLTKAGDLTSYIYPPAPLTANLTNAPGVMFNSQLIDLLGAVGITQDPAKGIMMLGVVDCANMPITDTANVSLSVKQGGVDVAGTTQVDASMFAAQLAGTFIIFNVPVGVTEVGATYKTKVLRKHDVRMFANSTTGTAVRPGF